MKLKCDTVSHRLPMSNGTWASNAYVRYIDEFVLLHAVLTKNRICE